MTLSFEILLILGAVALYIYDSICLLKINEFALFRNGDKWGYVYPSLDWVILRKWPFIPNPFRPDIDIFLVFWSTKASPRTNDKELHVFESKSTFLHRSALILFAIIFMVMPLVLMIYGGGVQLVVLFGFVYCSVAVVVSSLYRNREFLQLTTRDALLISLDCLACPPFAVNVLRKVTYRAALIGDPLTFAMRVLDRDQFLQLIDDVCSRIDMQLCWLDEGTPRYSVLVGYRDHVRGLVQ